MVIGEFGKTFRFSEPPMLQLHSLYFHSTSCCLINEVFGVHAKEFSNFAFLSEIDRQCLRINGYFHGIR